MSIIGICSIYSPLSQAVDMPSLLAWATVLPSSASWKSKAWLKRMINPLPSMPLRGDDLSWVGLDPSAVVTIVRSMCWLVRELVNKAMIRTTNIDVEVSEQRGWIKHEDADRKLQDETCFPEN